MLGEAGCAIPLGPGRTTIGRDPHNNIVINDDTVSSEHAVIEADDGRYWIRDRRSTNGTRLANKRIAAEEKYALKGGDRIRFADVDLMFVVKGYVPGGDTVYMKSTTTPPPPETAVAGISDIHHARRAAESAKPSSTGPRQPSTPIPHIAAPVADQRPREETDLAKGPSQEIVFAEERERLDPASVIDLDEDRPNADSAASNHANRQATPGRGSDRASNREAIERADRALAAISSDGELPSTPSLRASEESKSFSPSEAMLDAPTAPIKNVRADQKRNESRRGDSPRPLEIDVKSVRECLDYHLDRVAEISPDFAAFIKRGFQDELRTALPVAAKELIEQAHASNTICQRAYTFDRVRYVVCGLPGKMSEAQKVFGESFGGFTRVLSEHLQSASFRSDHCEILALLSFGFDAAPWVSLSVVPDEGQMPRIDLLSYEFLSEREHREIEPQDNPEISQSGIG